MENNMPESQGTKTIDAKAPKKGGITVSWQMIAGFLLVVIIAVFSYVNTHSVEMNFIFAKTNLPLIVIILASMLAGIVILLLIQYFNKRSKKKKIG